MWKTWKILNIDRKRKTSSLVSFITIQYRISTHVEEKSSRFVTHPLKLHSLNSFTDCTDFSLFSNQILTKFDLPTSSLVTRDFSTFSRCRCNDSNQTNGANPPTCWCGNKSLICAHTRARLLRTSIIETSRQLGIILWRRRVCLTKKSVVLVLISISSLLVDWEQLLRVNNLSLFNNTIYFDGIVHFFNVTYLALALFDYFTLFRLYLNSPTESKSRIYHAIKQLST